MSWAANNSEYKYYTYWNDDADIVAMQKQNAWQWRLNEMSKYVMQKKVWEMQTANKPPVDDWRAGRHVGENILQGWAAAKGNTGQPTVCEH